MSKDQEPIRPFNPHTSLSTEQEAMLADLEAQLNADIPPEGIMDGYSPDPHPGAPLEDTPEKIENHNTPTFETGLEAEDI